MRSSTSVLKIKQALLDLCKSMDPGRIVVQDVLDLSGVSRATFYKHFTSIHHLWHTISHDLVDSMALQLNTLRLSSRAGLTRISRETISKGAARSFVETANQQADFWLRNREYILYLVIEEGDPACIRKIHWLAVSILQERLMHFGYPEDKARDLSQVLSTGMLRGMLEGTRLDHRKYIYDSVMTTMEIVHALCQNRLRLEQLKQPEVSLSEEA